MGVSTFAAPSKCMEPSAEPDSIAIWKDLNPATGTPMKFTRSFPANAMARAKVPTRTMIFSMLIFLIRVRACRMMLHPTKLISMIVAVLSSTKPLTESGTMVDPLDPLISRKNRIAVMANPPQIPVQNL